ncbi:MAG TPA: response regulator [Nitrospinota bacterium]|nr:response regulator [Nitrospinota bacterium]
MSKTQIMIVEDEGVVAADIEESLKSLGYEVVAVVPSGEEALKEIKDKKPDLVLMDIVLDGKMNGIETTNEINSRFDIPVVYLTAYADEETLERVKVTEPLGYIIKPFEDRELHTIIEMALYKHKVEKKLKESEEWLSTTLKSIGDAVIATNSKGGVKFMNGVAQLLTGWKEEDAIGKTLEEVFHIVSEETGKKVENPVKRVLREGVVVGLANHTVLIAKDGTKQPIDDSGAPIRDSHGNIIGVVLIFRDITDRRRVEKALANEKELLAVTFRSIGDGVITTDRSGNIMLINKVAEGLTGWTQGEAIDKPLSEVFHIINEKTRVSCENPVEKVLQTGEIVGLANHTALIAKDGTERSIADSGAPIRDKESNIIGVVLVFRDITEKKKMEDELIKVRKLESVGILAGGIAHDFNNLLTSILGNVSLAKSCAKKDDQIIRILDNAEKASIQARNLTQQLLTFSKGGAPIKSTASTAELVRDSAAFAMRGSTVKCEFSFPDDLWAVEVDSGQISQVINNLIINADQAMPEGGIIEVSAENIAISAKDVLPLDEGNYVRISIKDQGIGISKEHLKKIFDPYFSTKQKGSGLGLATSYSIVKRHRGYITVTSELTIGTTFHIYLSASQKETTLKKKEKKVDLIGKGKILVMDDLEIVKELADLALRRMGYEVELAEDGSKAIELYKKAKESGKPFDAVIMDLTVPGGMGGKEAIQKLLEIDPKAKAIVSSGYSNDPVMADFRKHGFVAFLVKPFKLEELHKVLAEVLQKK